MRYSILLLVFIGVSFFTTDLIGRRPLLLGACVTIVLSLLGVGIAGTVRQTKSTSNALIVLSCIWVVAYASGIAPSGATYQGETATPRLRAKTNSFAQAIGGMFGLIFSYTVPLMLSDQQLGWGVKTGYFFAGTAMIGAVLIWFIMPEFKGREYTELDELFRRKIPTRQFKSTKTQIQLAREGNSA
jgi:SP family general alpha glucoside:H+ symporter-like MFS transporter